jgi:lipopolysaccharide exporter
MTLRKQAFSGVRWTSLSSFGRAALQLLQMTILARLLIPADFGAVAIAAALIAILQVLADAGISSAIVHFRDVTREEMDSLYWLNVGSAALLTLGLAAASAPIAAWYVQPSLVPLVQVAALTLFATSIGQQLRILAQKSLRFSDLAKVELGGAAIGGCTAVGAALLDAGAFALVAGTVATAAATSLLAWLLLAGDWRPALRMRWSDVRRFVNYGVFNIGASGVNAINMQLDVLMAGRLLGMPQIGAYNLSKDLSLRIAGFLNPIVTEVGFPVLAAAQADAALLRKLYLQMMRMTMSATFPAYVALAAFAPEIVRLVFGPAWEEAIPLLRILACWGLLRAIGNPVGILVLARGRPRLSLVWNVGQLIVLPPIVYVASRLGVQGIAVAMLLYMGLLYVPNWWFLVRPLCGATLKDYTQAVGVPLAVSAAAGVSAYAAVIPISGAPGRLVLGTVFGTIAYLAFSYRWNRPWFVAMVEMTKTRIHIGSRNARKQG